MCSKMVPTVAMKSAKIGAKRSQEAPKRDILASCFEHFARFGEHFEHKLTRNGKLKALKKL